MASIASVNEESSGWIELLVKVAICLRDSVTAVIQSSGRPGKETTARLRLRSNWCSKFTAPAFVFWADVGGPITCDASPSETMRFSALTAIIWMVFVTFFVTKWPNLVSTNETVNSLQIRNCYLTFDSSKIVTPTSGLSWSDYRTRPMRVNPHSHLMRTSNWRGQTVVTATGKGRRFGMSPNSAATQFRHCKFF